MEGDSLYEKGLSRVLGDSVYDSDGELPTKEDEREREDDDDSDDGVYGATGGKLGLRDTSEVLTFNRTGKLHFSIIQHNYATNRYTVLVQYW